MSERITKTPMVDCCKYICDNFADIIPFVVSNGYHFQIRLSPEVYEKVPEKYKSELKQFAAIGEQNVEDEVWNRYLLDFYWIYAKEYIFNFNLKFSIELNIRCVYGPESVEDCDETIIFVDSGELSEFILLNIGYNECGIMKYPELRKT
jgi:hypothetical protein